MKFLQRLFGFVLALCLFAVPAFAEDSATVTADGACSITIQPDFATFTVGVSTQDSLVATAQTANAAAMQAVIDSLKALGVADDDIQTNDYTVNALYDYQNGKFGNQEQLKGYEVSNTITVIVRKLDQVSALLDASVSAGANQTYGLTFDSTQRAAAYDQALQSATLDALRKAKLLASATGADVGKVVSLEELGSSYVTYRSMSDSVAYDSSSTPIVAGTLSITASVRAVLELK